MFKISLEPVEENTCKGLIFRPYYSYFSQDGRFEERRGMRLLKRKSCTGCKFCWNLMDHVKEVLAYYDALPIKGDIDTFKEYTVNVSGCEGEDIEFIPLENNYER